jgi:hypothetical protein
MNYLLRITDIVRRPISFGIGLKPNSLPFAHQINKDVIKIFIARFLF